MRKAVILAVVAMLCIAGVAYLVSMAHAGITIYVPGDYSTIQAAINAASNGDTIIVSNDTYTGSSNKNLDPLDKSITIKSANGPVNCIIDCQNSGRGFLIQRGEGNGTVIDGFTIEDANEANGAGILVAGSSSPIIKNCRLISNNAYWNNGGGIAIENYSDPKIIDCYINSNSANWGGAGIHISNHSDPEITDCTISSNSAGLNGGGIECNGSCSPTITGCNLTENSASSGGGGIACLNSSSPQVKSCKMEGNTASLGAGLYCESNAHPQITNCLITGNEASNKGGGIYCYGNCDPTITNCTIADNDATNQGGGIWSYWYSDPVLKNTIIWDNSATAGKQIWVNSATTTLYYCDYANGDGDVYGTIDDNNCITGDPDFVGGSPYDYRLLSYSPCYNAGNNNYISEDYDLAGNWRIIRGTVDIGAYEYGTFKNTAADRGIRASSSGADNAIWGDFDNDDYIDLYVLRDGGGNILYMNDGDNTFTDATSANGVGSPTYSRGACAADYDNDGDLDLLACNDGGNLYLYRNNRVGAETSNFTNVASSAGLTGFSYSVMAAWGDYDSDGYVDLYVVQSSGSCKLFQNDGDGTFTNVTSTAGVAGPASGSGAVWCDVNNDNKLDLYVVGTSTGTAKLYKNDGDGTFSDISSSSGANKEGKAVAAGDVDNDGDLDFYITRSGTSNYLLRNNIIPNETETFTNTAASAGVQEPIYGVDCRFVDFDNDGFIDLYVTASDANHDIYINDGDGTFSHMRWRDGGSFTADARGVTSVDLLGNGKQCFYVTRQSGYSEFYEQAINENNWLSIELVPSASNESAIGTRVDLTYWVGEMKETMTRVVTAGSGWGSQGSTTVDFGLGSMVKGSIDEIKVIWPTGVPQYIQSSDYELNTVFTFFEVTVEIVPDEGQCGTTGDTVESNKGSSGEKHYVSPKKAGDWVVLKAEVTPVTTTYEWDGGEAVAGHPEKRKVSRNSTGKTIVKLIGEGGGEDGGPQDLMNVWVVWSEIVASTIVDSEIQECTEQTHSIVTGTVEPTTGDSGPGTGVATEWFLVATIEPASMLDVTKDIPDLDDDKSQDVPEHGKMHILKGDALDDAASKKWDMTRQWRVKVVDSAAIGTTDYDYENGTMYHDLPDSNKVVVEYPEAEAEGNDDIDTVDEIVDPYLGLYNVPLLNPTTTLPEGKICSVDQPLIPLFVNRAGSTNDTIEWRFQFKEYARLQIGSNWYWISDPFEWKLHVKLKKQADGTWADDGSTTEANNTGW